MHFQLHFGAVYKENGEYGWSRNLDEIKRTFDWEMKVLGTDYADFGFLHCVDEESDPDYTIYGKFLSKNDRDRLDKIRALPPERKLKDGDYNFDDPKYYKLLWRLVGRNWPEVFDEEERRKWKNFCASRLINPPSKHQKTLELYMRECSEIIDSLERDAKDKLIAKKLMDYGHLLEKEILS